MKKWFLRMIAAILAAVLMLSGCTGQGTTAAPPDGTTAAKELGWSIARRSVTVTADGKSKAYGEPDPALTATVEGTLAGESVTYQLVRDAGDAVGSYAITPSGAYQM